MAVYFLILVGGIVRTTGSGMGCPDWPKCFGRWAPPSTVSDLPENYKEVYAASREKKNQKFAKYLNALGFTSTADKILTDKAIQTETEFNVVKSWIEYGNRIVAVIIGFFITALFWKSLRFRKTFPKLFYYSLATLIAVILQGWFGSIVVSTNLTTWTVTAHMFLALLIVVFLIYMVSLTTAAAPALPSTNSLRWITITAMVTLLIQVFLGTQVREAIDVIAARLPDRPQWIGSLGPAFTIHRLFAYVVLFLNLYLILKLKKTLALKALSVALLALILLTFLTGFGMAVFGVPAALQPIHLVLATGTFGVQLFLLFGFYPRREVLTKD
jgi:heme a synthase